MHVETHPAGVAIMMQSRAAINSENADGGVV
jgi:hypothetical protein